MFKIMEASYYAALVRRDVEAMKFWAGLFLDLAPKSYINRRGSWPVQS